MIENYFLWRFSMLLTIVLAFSGLVTYGKLANKILLHRRKGKECER